MGDHDHILDLAGLKCPLPALRTARALKAMAPGALLTVICTDPMTVIDIPHLVRSNGDELVSQTLEGRYRRFTIRRRGPAGQHGT